MTRYRKVLNGAAKWGGYYRCNPDEFAKDYLHLNLKLFQKILLVMMFWSTTFVFIACRGKPLPSYAVTYKKQCERKREG